MSQAATEVRPATSSRAPRPGRAPGGAAQDLRPVVAVDGVDLEIAEGEFFTLLGPSGSGKTTLLRLIAGFERPDSGTIELGGVDVTRQPPYARDVNTVFQDYALFPHMTRDRERRVRAEDPQGGRSPSADAGPSGCSRWSGFPGSGAASRSSCPGDSANVSRWPARSSTSRRCSCSTSRSERSTSSCARRCRSSSSASSERSGSPSCT